MEAAAREVSPRSFYRWVAWASRLGLARAVPATESATSLEHPPTDGTLRPVNIAALQRYCRSLPGATESIKWEDNLVFSVGGKMFAAFHDEDGVPVGFPCSDEEFERLTALPFIIPAPYAARFGWVSVRKKDALGQAEAKALVKAAHALVLAKLPKGKREKILAGD
jgi:predicted DNA-binding protein (MmcQ/YjbR family)